MTDELEGFEHLFAADALQEGEEDDAAPDTEAKIGVFANPPVDASPVTPLGFDGRMVVFAMPEGEIRFEPASKIGQQIKTDIFACQAGQSFLAYWRDEDGKFQRDLAVIWLVRKCREAGKWDDRRPQRGLGVWPGEGGAVVLHRGSEVWELKDRKVAKFSVAEVLRARLTGPLYKLFPPAPLPELKKSATRQDGEWIRETLDRWRFEVMGGPQAGDLQLTGADLVLGFIGSALLGALSPFRAHVLLYALQGSGKTTLLEFVHALLSAVGGDLVTTFTPAGLRQDLAGHARPVVFDETEQVGGGHEAGPIEQLLQMLTMMSTGSGSVRKEGSASGQGATQTAVGAVIMGGINPPPLPPALASRVAEIRLLPLTGPLVSRAEVLEAEAKAKAMAAALLGRALKSAGRFLDDHAAIAAAMARGGHAPRTADLVATLAAGRRLILADEALDADAADEEVRFWSALLDKRAEVEAVTNAGADALAHLMSWDTGQHYQDRRQTIGDLVRRWLKLGDRAEIETTLKNFGVRLYEDPKRGAFLIVANHHPALDKIFQKTNWAAYRRSFEYIDALGEAYKTEVTKALRYGIGIKQRGICIPLAPFLEGRNVGGGTAAGSGVPGSVPGQADEI